MITDGEKWHYLAVRGLPALHRGITSNNNGDFYCLNSFHSYRTYNILKRHERVYHKHAYCYIEMSKGKNKISKPNQGEKSLKAPFITYFDLECLLLKINSCRNNLENSYTERKAKHAPSGWAMFTKCSFAEIENKFDYYRGIDCIKKWCEKLRDRATEITNCKEKEMIPLKDKEEEFYEKQEVRHICKKEFCYDKNEEKKHLNYTKKSEIIAIILENLEEQLIVFAI